MAQVMRVEEKYEQTERVIVEDVLVRPAGFELFLTEDEARALRTFLGLGTTSKTLQHLGLENVWKELSANVNIKWIDFDQIAKLES